MNLRSLERTPATHKEEKMRKKLFTLMLAMLFMFMGAVVGCDSQGPAEKAGEKIDETAESLKESADEIGDEITGEGPAEEMGEKIDEAAEEIEEAAESKQ